MKRLLFGITIVSLTLLAASSVASAHDVDPDCSFPLPDTVDQQETYWTYWWYFDHDEWHAGGWVWTGYLAGLAIDRVVELPQSATWVAVEPYTPNGNLKPVSHYEVGDACTEGLSDPVISYSWTNGVYIQ